MAEETVTKLVDWARERERRARARGPYANYSLLFVPFALLVLAGLPLSGRGLIWNVDGLSQYYPFFVYEGQWLRGIFASLFGGQGLQVPLWEWCSGYGADVITTFDVFFDPLNLVSVLTPGAASEWVFQLLVVLRLYLAGLGFVCYCQTREENKAGTVLGALLYALSGAGLLAVRWSSGLHALILFPVVLAGAERVLKGQKPWLFVAALFGLAFVSYYFTYMAIILLVAYLALRVVMVEGKQLTAGRFFAWVLRFAGLSLLSLALAAVALAPAVFALVGMDRLVDTQVSVPILYDARFYASFATSFLSTAEVGSDTFQGFGGLAFLACVLLVSRKGEQRALKLVLAVLTLMMLLPCFGSFMNAMNYASNRWAWAYNLCVAFVLVRMTPRLVSPEAGDRRVLVGACCAYAVLLVVPYCRTEANVAGFAALLAALIIVTGFAASPARRSLLVCALGITLGVNGFYFLSASEGGWASGQAALTMAYRKLTDCSADVLATEVEDDEWWRYDAGQADLGAGAPVSRVRNNSLVLGLQGIDFYNSVYNDRIDAFHTELGIAGDDINFSYLNLQGRSDLMTLLGVRYYLYRGDGLDAIPYGYEGDAVVEHEVMGVPYRLMRAARSLPLGMCFDRALSREDYLALTPVERQQALLQAIVLKDPAAHAPYVEPCVPAELAFEDQELPFTVANAQGVTVEDGRLVVSAPGSSLTLAVDAVPQSDAYLCFDNLTYDDLRPSERVSEEERAAMGLLQRANLLLDDLGYQENVIYQIRLLTDASPLVGYITNRVPSNHMYGGKEDWAVSLGFTEEGARSVTLVFDQPGAYSFDGLSVVAQRHELREAWLDERLGKVLQDVRQGCNVLTGTVTLEKPQTLLLTVAYGAGWRAFVDGVEVPIMPADTGFMAIDVEAGAHEVELRYFTPGLAEGAMVSGAALAALVVLAIVLRRCERS